MRNENSSQLKVFETAIEINVRFSDTDAMGVVWHGNYLRYFEDAREAFGDIYKMSYLNLYSKGFFTPIVKSDIDYKAPIFFGEKVLVKTKYIPVAAAKIIFCYEVINLTTGKICAVGKTIQVFLNSEKRTLELNKPDFYLEWEKKNGMII